MIDQNEKDFLKKVAQDRKELSKLAENAEKQLQAMLLDQSSTSAINRLIGCARYEYSKKTGLKGLKSGLLSAEYLDTFGSTPCAVKLADEEFFNELLCHHVLEEKNFILPKGVYLAYVDKEEDASLLRLYLSVPLAVVDPKEFKNFSFEKFLMIKIDTALV